MASRDSDVTISITDRKPVLESAGELASSVLYGQTTPRGAHSLLANVVSDKRDQKAGESQNLKVARVVGLREQRDDCNK